MSTKRPITLGMGFIFIKTNTIVFNQVNPLVKILHGKEFQLFHEVILYTFVFRYNGIVLPFSMILTRHELAMSMNDVIIKRLILT